MASVSAFAQSSVTVYGLLDVGFNQTKTTNAAGVSVKTTNTGGNSAGGWASNRLGFKGTEDMGGGTKADFVYELALAAGTDGKLSASSTSTVSAARQSWVGLTGSAGQIQVGRQYNPAFLLNIAHDAGGANNLSAGRTVYGNGPVTTARTNGLVTYTAPTYYGLTGKIAAGNNSVDDSSATNTTGTRVLGGSLVYATGPMSLSYGFNKINALNAAGDKDENILGATYKVEKATLLASFGDSKTKDAAGAQTLKRKAYQLGLRYPITPTIDAFATYGRGKINTTAGVAESTVKGAQAGAMYNLSKRTGLYAAYGRTSGDISNVDAASKGTEFALGVRHSF